MDQFYAYTRVSTLKQGDGVSLKAQRSAIYNYAEKQNLQIIDWLEEKETAAKQGRPIYTGMVKALRKGRAKGVIVHKLDRLTRNLSEYAQIGELIDAGIVVHTAVDSLDVQSRGGRLTAEIQAVISADFIRNLRDETIKGMRGRLKQGLYPNRAPVGYLDNGRGQVKTIDPERGPLVRKAFQLYSSGRYPIKRLLPKLQILGLTNRCGGPISLRGLETILGNPFYTGVIRVASTGETFIGKHKPLISPALFERVQDVKAGRSGPKLTRHNHTYRGQFRCGLCGDAMIPERQKGHVYYRCQRKECATKTVREEVLVSAINACLANAQLKPEQICKVESRIEQWIEELGNQDHRHEWALKNGKLQERKSRLTDALVDGLIDKETFHHRSQRLLLDEQALALEQEDYRKKLQSARRLRTILELTKTLERSHQMADRAEKRQIVELATSNRHVIGKKVYLEPQDWLVGLGNAGLFAEGDPSPSKDRTFSEILERYEDFRRLACSCIASETKLPQRHAFPR